MGQATAAGAGVNMILNYVLIMNFGLIGAAAATLASYYCMFAIAFFRTKKHISMNINIIRDHCVYLLLLAEGILCMRRIPYYHVYNAVITLVILIIYFRQIKEIVFKKVKELWKR